MTSVTAERAVSSTTGPLGRTCQITSADEFFFLRWPFKRYLFRAATPADLEELVDAGFDVSPDNGPWFALLKRDGRSTDFDRVLVKSRALTGELSDQAAANLWAQVAALKQEQLRQAEASQ